MKQTDDIKTLLDQLEQIAEFGINECTDGYIRNIAINAIEIIENLKTSKTTWEYYQNLIKSHGAHSITELIVQRDKYKDMLNS